MNRLSPLALSLALLVPASAYSADGMDEAKKLQGDWTITDWYQGGVTMPVARLSTVRWALQGDRYSFALGDSEEEGTVKVDAGQKPPTIDLSPSTGDAKGKEQLGIFKIDGETVTICLARPGSKDRPTEFTSTRSNRQILMTVKRARKVG
jgi:uncharacterized protein (TIGR03067 family)